jgi:hypothetical protein
MIMKACEITIDKRLTAEQKNAIEQLLGEHQSLEQIITGWMNCVEHEIRFYQGVDDDRPEVELLGVQLLSAGSQHAVAYYLKEEISQLDKDFVLVSQYIRGYDRNGAIDLDTRAFDSWEDRLGFSFSFALCTQIAPQKALMPFILSYILSDGGEIAITSAARMDREMLEDIQEDLVQENIDLENTWQVYANYHSREMHSGVIPGWGCHKYIRLDSQSLS